MSGKKMVDLENISVLSDMMDIFVNTLKDPSQINMALDIKMYIVNNILEEDKMYINKLKRSIYLQMKNADSEEKNKMLYEIYQTLKGP